MYRSETNEVLAYWHGRSLRAREAYAMMGAFLLRLRERSTHFDKLYAMVQEGYVPLRQDLSDIETVLSRNMNLDYNFTNDDPADKSFTLESRAYRGFRGHFTNAARDEDQTLVVKVVCGIKLRAEFPPVISNLVIIEFASELEPPLLQTLLAETVLFWRPSDAIVTSWPVMKALDRERGEFRPGWLTYIADPAVADALPRDIAWERFAEGMLIQIAEHPGTDADPDYLARLRQLRDILRPGGWLNRPVYGTSFGERMPDVRDVRARRAAGVRPS